MDGNAPYFSIATLDDRLQSTGRYSVLSPPLIIKCLQHSTLFNSSSVVVIPLAQQTLALLQTPLPKPNHKPSVSEKRLLGVQSTKATQLN
jgi:hypothetical protein